MQSYQFCLSVGWCDEQANRIQAFPEAIKARLEEMGPQCRPVLDSSLVPFIHKYLHHKQTSGSEIEKVGCARLYVCAPHLTLCIIHVHLFRLSIPE